MFLKLPFILVLKCFFVLATQGTMDTFKRRKFRDVAVVKGLKDMCHSVRVRKPSQKLLDLKVRLRRGETKKRLTFQTVILEVPTADQSNSSKENREPNRDNKK